MRILHLTSHLDVGGVSRSVLSLAAELAQRGHRTAIAAAGGELEPEVRLLGVPHWPVPLHTSIEFSPQVAWAAWRLAEHLERRPMDVLHAHTRVSQVVAAWLSARLAIPYVTTWHGFFRPNLGRRLWPCTGMLTIAISEPVRQHLIRDFGVAESRIRLIPHGIDASMFAVPSEPAAQQRLRAQLQLPPDAPVIGTVARLVASKGVDQLLRSLPALRAAVPNVRLLIVGDGEERESLERLAGELGVAEAVRFSGTLAQTRLALSLMQVFVFLPAEEEGFGLALLEAMAAGRPIVAVRRGGGATWLLDESRIAALVEPGDPARLAEAVRRLLQDGAAAQQAGAAAQALVQERFTLARMTDAVEAVYREAAALG